MFLPIGDQPNPRGTPYVNYGLMAINVLIFLAVTLPLTSQGIDLNDPLFREYLLGLMRQYPDMDPELLAQRLAGETTAYDLFLLQWGYRPGEPSLVTLMSSMFLHGGWLHLLGNMLFLWIYGDNVEHRLGRAVYLLAYLITGAFAAFSYGLVAPAAAGGTPMVGASGAISGVLGFYFLWFPRNKVRLLVVLFPFFFDVWLVGARIVLGFYLIIENLLPFLLTPATGGGVAYGAHIGGFIAGLGGASVLNSWARRRCHLKALEYGEDSEDSTETPPPRSGSPRLDRTPLRVDPLTFGAAAVARALESGRHGKAIRGYFDLSSAEQRQVPVAVVVELADWLAASQQPDAALAMYQQAQQNHPRAPEMDRIFLGMGLVLLRGMNRPTAAYPFLLDALDANPSPQVARQAREALAIIERQQKHQIRFRKR